MPVVLVTGKPLAKNEAVSATQWRTAFVQNDLPDDRFVAKAFHEFCHLHQSRDFEDRLTLVLNKHPGLAGTSQVSTAYFRIMEGIAEFAATLWSGESGDSFYETRKDLQTHKLTLAMVSALSRDTGNPADCKITDEDMRRGATDKVTDDLKPGIDALYRAYFIGDPAAMAKLEYAINSLVEQPGFHDPSAYYAALESKSARDRSEL